MTCDICSDLPAELFPSSLCARHSRDYSNCILIEARGNYYQKNGQLQEALSCYMRALDILPKFISALFQIVLLFQQSGLYAKALHYVDEWLKISPNDGTALVARGITLCWLGKYHDAIKNFDLARIFAHYVSPLNQKAVCHAYALIEVGQFTEALLLCNKVPKHDPFYSDIKMLKKQCYQRLGLEPRWKTLVRNTGARVISDYPSILHDLTTLFGPPYQLLLPRRPA